MDFTAVIHCSGVRIGSRASITRNSGVVATRATGVKSRTTSYGTGSSPGWISILAWWNSSVWPSELALATTSPAVVPAAPGRLSTSIGTPSRSDRRSASRRATASATPPAGNGTIRRIGRFGNAMLRTSCGPATAGIAGTARASVAQPRAYRHRKGWSQCRSTAHADVHDANFTLPRQSCGILRTSVINFLPPIP
ncbi:hypothetical protein D3C81_1032120 [compost metagenome]